MCRLNKNILKIISVLIINIIFTPLLFNYGGEIDYSIDILLIILVCVTFYYYIKIKNPVSIIFLVAHFNFLILCIINFLSLPFSYLEDQFDRNSYDTALILEIFFYLMIGFIAEKKYFQFSDFENRLIINVKMMYISGCALVFSNIIFVLPYLGLPYIELHEKHTIFSEIGWMLVALSVLYSNDISLVSKRSILIYLLVILSMILGARLQISFAILAILIRYFLDKSKFYIYIILGFITANGILVGVLRDLNGFEIDLISIFSSINQGASLRTASVYISAINDGFFNEIDRLYLSLVTFVFAWLPSSVFGNIAHINLIISDYSLIQGNGGLVGTYLYLFFGFTGALTAVLVLGASINYSIHRSPIFVSILILSSYRWQLYNFLPIIKLMYLFMFITILYIIVRNVFMKGRGFYR